MTDVPVELEVNTATKMASLFESPWRKLASGLGGSATKVEDDDDEETRSFLSHNVQRHAQTNSKHKIIVAVTLLNAVILLLTATLFAIWYNNQYLVKNADLRRTSSYSMSLPSQRYNPLANR